MTCLCFSTWKRGLIKMLALQMCCEHLINSSAMLGTVLAHTKRPLDISFVGFPLGCKQILGKRSIYPWDFFSYDTKHQGRI